MPSIKVTVNVSYSNIQSGKIEIFAKQPFTDSTGKIIEANILLPIVTVTGGSASFQIDSTEDFGIAYTFKIYSGTSPNFVFVRSFDAIIKNVSPQNFSNIAINSYFSNDLLDQSVQTISDLLTKAPYIDRLAGRIPGFNFKVWNATMVFNKNDFTFRGERYYQWIRDTQGSNIDPLTVTNVTDPGGYLDGTVRANTAWQVASRSLVGSGTATTDLDYNKTAFNPLNTQPASRRNLVQLEDLIRSSIASPDLSSYARVDQNNSWTVRQSFSNGATVPDTALDSVSQNAVNARTLLNALQTVGGINLIDRFFLIEERQDQGISANGTAGNNTRALNFIQKDCPDLIGKAIPGFRVRPGTYFVLASAVSNRADRNKLVLVNQSTNDIVSSRSMSGFSGSNLLNNAGQNIENFLIDVVTIVQDTSMILRHVIETGGSGSLGNAANRPGLSEVYSRVLFFRLS